MKALRFLASISFLFTHLALSGQQLPVLSSYYFNPQLSNPAFAGLNGNNIFLLNRNQWQNKKKSPETYLMSMDGNIKNGKSGYGFLAYSDVINVISRTGIFGTYNYRLVLPQNSLLSIGASMGVEQNRLSREINPEIPIELSMTNKASQVTRFDGNLGIAYQINRFNIGIAAYRIFGNNPVMVNADRRNCYSYYFGPHIIGSASYQFVAAPGILNIDPTVRVRMAKNTNPQLDFSLVGNYKDKASLGVAYRQHYGLDFTAGAKLYKKMTVAYTLALATATTNYPGQYTHEILLGYKLNSKNSQLDSDKDGVINLFDREPKTTSGCAVDKYGVSLDTDLDNVPDCSDLQPGTPFGAPIDKNGIALDSDKDEVIDLYDQEPETPQGYIVDKSGIAIIPQKNAQIATIEKESKPHKLPAEEVDEMPIDTDSDEIPDFNDKEPETPHWQHVGGKQDFDASKCIVDHNGIATDSDGDGVMDCVDEEIFSPKGAKVNKQGISNADPNSVVPEKAEDSDADGISDDLDLEPNTPKGASIDQWGRSPKVNTDPAAVHRIAVEEIEDNSSEWNYYVIIGVFRYYNNLKNYQKYLLKTYNEPSNVLVTEQNYYYAWTTQVSTRLEAQKEVERLSSKRLKDYIVGNPWLWRESKKK